MNDLSGSPLVFSMVLQEYVIQGKEVILFTSNSNGFLSDLDGVRVNYLPYKWFRNKWLTLLNFLFVQVVLFFKVLFISRNRDVVYVNTLLPFAALLAARIRGLQTIQHMHEVSVRPAFLLKFLCFISEHFTDKMIFVSAYLKSCFNYIKPEQKVVHNKLDDQFLRMVSKNEKGMVPFPFTVLMLCSLKEYKGVYVFLNISRKLPQYKFILVLNASDQDIQRFISENKPPLNCEILPPSRNTHPYYRQAHVLVNLSLPDQWIETFGMTILEAKAYGIKVIAPPVGGPAEIVNVPEDGFLVDSRNEDELIQKLNLLKEDIEKSESFSTNKSGNKISVA